jgi:hypothetical protein
MTIVTGDFWNEDNPSKPWGEFDVDAELVFPLYVTDWLAKMGTTYSGHTVIGGAPLDCSAGVHATVDDEEVVYVRVKLADTAPFKVGTKYPFTLRLIGANGPDSGGTQSDDRTWWLKIVQR